jgi:NAD kinase
MHIPPSSEVARATEPADRGQDDVDISIDSFRGQELRRLWSISIRISGDECVLVRPTRLLMYFEAIQFMLALKSDHPVLYGQSE